MKEKVDLLIAELASELKPVQVVRFKKSDVVKVVSAGLLCVFAAIAISGFRSDISAQALNAKFIFDTGLLLLLGVLSIVASFSLSIPSLNAKNSYRLPFFVFGLIVLATGFSFITTSNPFLYLGHGFSCVSKIVSISILPAAILFYLVRRAAALKRDLVGILVLLSGASFGLFGVQFTCIDATPMHLVLWHILPTATIMVFGIWISRKILHKI